MLEYTLGWRTSAGLKAEKGNVVHKALELLARRKLAEQNDLDEFHGDDIDRTFKCETVVPNYALDVGYDHYSNPEKTIHQWADKDRTECRKWMWMILNHNEGMFNPLNRDIVAPEQYFDYEIDQPWAAYSYTLPNGKTLEGRLALKGTVDLVTRVAPGVIEYVDYKTGERKDWKTGKPKEYKDLRDDPQMRIYHHALHRLYPGQQIIITIFFVRSGGPFSLCFDDSDIERTEQIIRKRFEAIRDNVRPKLIYGQAADRWKCIRLCDHHKKKWEDTDKTVCQHMRDEIQTLGMERVMKKYGSNTAFDSYGDGGGRTGVT
jgi:hypothetical protein